MILQHAKDPIAQFFVEGPRLKTEGVQEGIGAATLPRITLRPLQQFPAKALPARRRGQRERPDVKPSVLVQIFVFGPFGRRVMPFFLNEWAVLLSHVLRAKRLWEASFSTIM